MRRLLAVLLAIILAAGAASANVVTDWNSMHRIWQHVYSKDMLNVQSEDHPVLLTEAPDGGWGLAGHANTNAELVQAARAQLAAGRAPAGD